jgi:hypothetical protein
MPQYERERERERQRETERDRETKCLYKKRKIARHWWVHNCDPSFLGG